MARLEFLDFLRNILPFEDNNRFGKAWFLQCILDARLGIAFFYDRWLSADKNINRLESRYLRYGACRYIEPHILQHSAVNMVLTILVDMPRHLKVFFEISTFFFLLQNSLR